jgi:hypothetical protein
MQHFGWWQIARLLHVQTSDRGIPNVLGLHVVTAALTHPYVGESVYDSVINFDMIKLQPEVSLVIIIQRPAGQQPCLL